MFSFSFSSLFYFRFFFFCFLKYCKQFYYVVVAVVGMAIAVADCSFDHSCMQILRRLLFPLPVLLLFQHILVHLCCLFVQPCIHPSVCVSVGVGVSTVSAVGCFGAGNGNGATRLGERERARN